MIHILSHGEANGEDAKRNVPEIVHKLGEQRHRFWCGDAYLEYEIKVATGTAAWGVSASVTARQQLTQPILQQVRQRAAMDILHTVTPKSMRGMGVAERLCDAAFAHAMACTGPQFAALV